jgi:hypothetical protein
MGLFLDGIVVCGMACVGMSVTYATWQEAIGNIFHDPMAHVAQSKPLNDPFNMSQMAQLTYILALFTDN